MRRRAWTRTTSSSCLLLVLAACGGARPPAALPSDVGLPVAASPSTDPVLLAGDAATNPACSLASVPELERRTGLAVRDELGVTSPGAISRHTYSCTWHFADTELAGPAVVVMFEVLTRPRPEVAAYLRSLVAAGTEEAIAGVAGVAVFAKHSTEVLDGLRHVETRVQLHDDLQERDLNVEVLRLVLPRVPNQDPAP